MNRYRLFLFVLLAANLIVVLYCCAFNTAHSASQVFLYRILPCASLAAVAIISRSDRVRQKRWAEILLAVILAAYTGESSLLFVFKTEDIAVLNSRAGVNQDLRTPLEVATQMRRSGQNVFPYGFFPPLEIGGKEVRPFTGTASLRRTVYSNETGKWILFDSDEFGFRNPRGTFKEANCKLAIVGDSFVLGHASESGEDFADLIRKQIPSTVSLGNDGAGPLTQLAMVREYLTHLRPRQVLFFFNEGSDVSDLENERKDPVLLNYLQPGYNQNLWNLQPALDRAMEEKAWQPKAVVTESAHNWKSWLLHSWFTDFILLRSTRSVLPFHASQEAFAIEVFRQTLLRAKSDVEGWGGRFYLVYFPNINSYRRDPKISLGEYHDVILALCKQEKIQCIDLREILGTLPDPEGIFRLRSPGTHLTPQGNRAVADALLKTIDLPIHPEPRN